MWDSGNTCAVLTENGSGRTCTCPTLLPEEQTGGWEQLRSHHAAEARRPREAPALSLLVMPTVAMATTSVLLITVLSGSLFKPLFVNFSVVSNGKHI